MGAGRKTWVLVCALCGLAGPLRAGPPEPPALVLLPAPPLVELDAEELPEEALFVGREADVPCSLELDPEGRVVNAACEAQNPALRRGVQRSLARSRFAPPARSGPLARARFVWRQAFSAARLEEGDPALRAAGRWDASRAVEVQGEVLEAGQRQAAAGAEVVAQGLGVAAQPDGKGRFRMLLPPGSHVLVASGGGFFNGQERVEVHPGQPARVTVFLRRRDVSQYSATVQGERLRRAPAKAELVREELRNVPGTQGDPVRVLEALPGLARVPYSGGKLIVRGGSAVDTGAYVDGQRIPQLYHLLQGPSVLGEEMVDRIDFYPGGAGVYFGRSLSGVVAVQSRKGDAERFHGSAAVDLQKSAAFLQGPIDEATQFAVGARVSYVNPLLKLILPSDVTQAVPLYWDYQARLDHRLGPKDRLQLTLFGSDDRLETVGDVRGSVPLLSGRRLGFHRARILWEHALSDTLAFSVAPSLGFDTSSVEITGAGGTSRPQTQSGRTFSTGGRAELTWRAGELLELRAGLDVLFDRVGYQQDLLFDQQLRGLGAPNAEARQLDGVRVFGSFAETLEAELRLGPLRLTPGLRVEELRYAGTTWVLFDPRLWARLPVWTGGTLFAYAGVYHQPPQAEQVDAAVGNPHLRPLRADQFGGGIEQRFGADWTIKAEGWTTRRKNLVFPAAARARPDGTYDNPLLLNSGAGEAVGLELLVRRELGSRMYGWIAYTLSRSQERPAPDQPWQATPYDQPHVLTLLFALRVSPYVEFAARLRLASGNPLSDVLRTVFDADSGEFVAVRAPLGSSRLPTFAQLDFEVNNIWVADLFNLQFYVDFQNLLSRDNPEALLYDYRWQRTAFARGVPFSAAVGVRAAF